MRTVIRWLGIAIAVPILVVLAGFGLLQTRAGKDWLAETIARSVSHPGFTVSIDGLHGLLPFRIKVDRIAVADARGTYLTLRGVGLDLAPADLLRRTLHIRSFEMAKLEMARSSSSGSSGPLSEYLRVPRLPVAFVLDRVTIARVLLMPPVLGERVVATVAGNGEIRGGTAQAALDLHRTDGFPGKLALAMTLTEANPVLSLQLAANEPTGILLDRWLGRTDRLPLTLSLDGNGPLTSWHGRLTAAAGALARVDAQIALDAGSETVLGLSGTAAMARLLPPEIASVVGDRATFSLHAELGKRIAVNRLAIGVAAGTIAGDSAFDQPGGAVTAHLRVDIPELALLSGVLRTALHGSAILNVAATGNRSRPDVKVNLSGVGINVSGSGAQRVEVHVSAEPTGSLADPATPIAVAANGRIEGLVIPQAAAVAHQLGAGIDWSFAATADRNASAIDVTRLSARGGGLDLTGSGHLAQAAHGMSGMVDLAGSATRMRTGIAAVDALLGSKATFSVAAGRDQAGAIAIDRLALNSAAAKLSGDAHFDPASRQLTAALALDLPQLKPLGPALHTELAGSVAARVRAEGIVDHLRLAGEVDGKRIAAAGAVVERLRVSGVVADLSQPKPVIDGSFRAFGLDGTLALAAELNRNSELVVPRLRLTAADSAIEGKLRVALATGLVQGSLTGRLPDLARWSALAHTPLAGSLDLIAGLTTPGGGQGLDLSVNGARLAAGAGSSRIEIGRLALTARLADIRRAPAGTGRLSLSAAHVGAAELAAATASFTSARPGRFVFQADANGQPLSLALAGEAGIAPGLVELRLDRLSGLLGTDRFALEQPLSLSRRGADLAVSGLALRLGTGRITGNAAVKGEAVGATLNVADLPIATAARLIGHPGTHGTLSLTANLGGSLRAPHGHLVVNAGDLSLAVARHVRGPRLGLTVEGDWNGRALDVQGRVTGLAGDRMSFTGALPLLLTHAPLGVSVPSQGALALRLQGGGDVGRLADLLPLGEDRLSGRFDLDVAVGGTVAAPAAGGQLRLTGARYENFATGAVLTNLAADLVGDRDRFRLASFSAGDGASGTVKAQGSLVLSGAAGPSAELSATLANFRVAARDEAVVTMSGTASVSGPLAAPKAVASLTVDRADISLPDSLPPSVIVVPVTEIGGGTVNRQAPAQEAAAFAAALDITIAMPGQVFVRGHGLNSDWHGRLKITGTSTAPQITGMLVANRGSVDLLGKTFQLTRGAITFDGSAKLDPALDIIAEVSAADITAQVIITGYASAPKITLASTPAVPQDEILSRVLFNQGVGQITAAQGVQLAQAAATLAGGGPGVLDRLRGKLGLDWLGFGQGPGGAASPILNPSVVNPSASSATAVSAGKYLMPGVSVGVTQGVSPPTSKVTVEVDVGHHVTVDTEAGQNGGTGIGLNYKYDY
jgi:translocation and assembly module TamB